MARIRSIHPSACTSEKLAYASAEDERCYWRLQTHCDDEGRCEDHARLIWAALFPLNEDVDAGDVDRWLDELHEIGLIERYEVDGKRYLCVVGWAEKQSPRHPTPSKFPSLPDRRAVPPEDRAEMRESYGDPPHEKEVGEGEGVGGGEGHVELAPLALVPADPVKVIFEVWQEATRHQKAVLDKKRRTAIVNARKHYPDEDLMDSCRGVMLSKHNQGGTNGSRYDDIALVLRDSEHIERFRDLYRGEARGDPRHDKHLGALARVALDG